jgi:4-amino-4-deoxy-L-arabinose transferase-like glycosyltransferase
VTVGHLRISVRAVALVAAVALMMLLAVGVRLGLGLRTQLDADEASLALAALHITHGQFVLMEPDAQYLGALDAYVAAPFVALLGAGTLSIRLALAFTGALYVVAMYGLGRTLFNSRHAGLLAAFVAAVFPLFTVYWSVKLRGGYTELPTFEALALILVARIGWEGAGTLRWWALLGLVAGFALWSDVLILVVFAVIAVALLLRAPAIGRQRMLGGVGLACTTGLIGLAPWIAYNVPNHLHSIRAIPKVYTTFAGGVSTLAKHQLPVLVGGSSSCGHDVVPPALSDTMLALLVLALLWLRKKSLINIVSGRWSDFEPLDVTLALVPASLLYLVLSRLDSIPCEPRYLMPLGVPLVIAVVTVLATPWRLRLPAVGASAAWLVVSGVAAAGMLTDMLDYVPGAQVPFDLRPGLAMLRKAHPQAIWAQYWLSRPLSYLSGDTLPIGEYGGYVGFVERQQQVETALDVSWVFVRGQADIVDFEKSCRDRGITFTKVRGGGLVLYTHLSGTLEPPDVLPGSAGHID